MKIVFEKREGKIGHTRSTSISLVTLDGFTFLFPAPKKQKHTHIVKYQTFPIDIQNTHKNIYTKREMCTFAGERSFAMAVQRNRLLLLLAFE